MGKQMARWSKVAHRGPDDLGPSGNGGNYIAHLIHLPHHRSLKVIGTETNKVLLESALWRPGAFSSTCVHIEFLHHMTRVIPFDSSHISQACTQTRTKTERRLQECANIGRLCPMT